MTEGVILEIVSRSIITIIIVSAPVLLISMVIGLIISVFQATTSIQDQTLTFVPKIIAIFVTLIIFGPWMLNQLRDYTVWLFEYIALVN